MKGLTHLVAGVAAASCFPEAVRAGAAGNPLCFILGAMFGLLPDTLDFKFVRFFSKHDMAVVPDPNQPDPQMIADAVAYAANKASASGRSVRIKLNTIRLGADRWQRYTVRFDIPAGRVVVEYGPVVGTGGMPYEASACGNDLDPDPEDGTPTLLATAPLVCPVSLDYQATNIVDIFDGPMLKMTPDRHGRVCPEFIPWHRRWSHSFALGCVAAVVAAALFGWLAGLVVFAAASSHVLLDQVGFMGSSLSFPFKRKRIPGLGISHSSTAAPNLLTIWLCCLLVFSNLARLSPAADTMPNLPRLLLYGAAIPLGCFALADRLLRLRTGDIYHGEH